MKYPTDLLAEHRDRNNWRRQRLTLYKAIALLEEPQLKLAIDCGAFVGGWTRVMDCIFDRVVAIEPIPENVACIKENVPDAEVIEALVYDECRDIEARVIDPIGWVQLKGRGHRQNFKAITIDSLNLKPDLLKMDIEGYEMQALSGADKTIRECHPIIVIEYDLAAQAISNHLTNLGYRQVYSNRLDAIWRHDAEDIHRV